MVVSTITSKGQTTVPQVVRERMHAEAGTVLTWTCMPDGSVLVRAKSGSVLDLAGILKRKGGKAVRIEEMNPWR